MKISKFIYLVSLKWQKTTENYIFSILFDTEWAIIIRWWLIFRLSALARRLSWWSCLPFPRLRCGWWSCFSFWWLLLGGYRCSLACSLLQNCNAFRRGKHVALYRLSTAIWWLLRCCCLKRTNFIQKRANRRRSRCGRFWCCHHFLLTAHHISLQQDNSALLFFVNVFLNGGLDHILIDCLDIVRVVEDVCIVWTSSCLFEAHFDVSGCQSQIKGLTNEASDMTDF